MLRIQDRPFDRIIQMSALCVENAELRAVFLLRPISIGPGVFPA